MVTEDGQPDMDKCAVCHNDDLSLTQPRTDLCTMCHSENHHSGALRHLQASSASVTQMLGAKSEPALPLTDEGRIFCGTCHIFHDPAVSGEEALPAIWLPDATGISGATRAKLEARLRGMAAKHEESEPGATFATKGTKAMRLPVSDGALCRNCHGEQK